MATREPNIGNDTIGNIEAMRLGSTGVYTTHDALRNLVGGRVATISSAQVADLLGQTRDLTQRRGPELGL